MNSDEEESGEEQGGGLQMEVIKSYLDFGKRAIKKYWLLGASVVLVGVVVTCLAVVYLPRKYACTTILIAQTSSILDSRDAPMAFAGADSLILRHENLEHLIHDIDLIRKFKERRPKLLALKDLIMKSLFGELSQKDEIAVMVATLESRLNINVQGGSLTVTAIWTDRDTAAEIAEAAQESYVKVRHENEMAAFQEKMSILDDHAKKLRSEIDALAQQIHSIREEKLAQAGKAATRAAASTAATPAPAARPVASQPRLDAMLQAESAAQAEEKKKELETKKAKLQELETERERRLREERAKLADLKLRLTESHPEVQRQEARLDTLAQPSSEILLLRSEVQSLQSDIKQRSVLAKAVARGPAGAPSAPANATAADPIPLEIVQLLGQDDTDPVLVGQLASKVSRRSGIMDELDAARVQLDTAQAAFNQRYKVMVPAIPPSKPFSPKVAMILPGGIIGSLVLALAVAILMELRTGIIIERWQVHQLQLPILAELRLPPHSPE